MWLANLDFSHYRFVRIDMVFGPGDTETFPGNIPLSESGFPIGLGFCSLAFGAGGLNCRVPQGETLLYAVALLIMCSVYCRKRWVCVAGSEHYRR